MFGHVCLVLSLALGRVLCYRFFVFHYYVDDLAKSCSSFIGSFIVLYADDILLLAPTVSQLQQKLLTNCESVLDQLDMIINSKKSCCLRIGQTVRGLTIHVLLCVHYPVS